AIARSYPGSPGCVWLECTTPLMPSRSTERYTRIVSSLKATSLVAAAAPFAGSGAYCNCLATAGAERLQPLPALSGITGSGVCSFCRAACHYTLLLALTGVTRFGYRLISGGFAKLTTGKDFRAEEKD